MPDIALQCTCCGYMLTFPEEAAVRICPACATPNARPVVEDNALDMLGHAIRQRLGCDFANAERSYQQVLLDYPDAHEALWGRLLCHYGVEYVEDAILDARHNSQRNGITNTAFYAGDMARVLTEDFVSKNGKPDVVITDPPRAGMHEKVVEQLLKAAPRKIVYISCNPATQARDVMLLSDKYAVGRIQPVDMFPHTQHVENVIELILK